MPGSFRPTEMDNTSFKESLRSFSQCFHLETEQEGQCCTISQQANCSKMYILGYYSVLNVLKMLKMWWRCNDIKIYLPSFIKILESYVKKKKDRLYINDDIVVYIFRPCNKQERQNKTYPDLNVLTLRGKFWWLSSNMSTCFQTQSWLFLLFAKCKHYTHVLAVAEMKVYVFLTCKQKWHW